MSPSTGFAPVAGANARLLVLGSLPGRRSLDEQQYYAHPRNAFWSIMAELVSARGDYAERCRALVAARIALWDVLHRSVRPGSLDSDIRADSCEANDLRGFFRRHAGIEAVVFNGRAAEKLYRRHVGTGETGARLRFHCLPSTSPANAAMSYDEKLSRWRAVVTAVAGD